jgi:hypothetical protein
VGVVTKGKVKDLVVIECCVIAINSNVLSVTLSYSFANVLIG